MADRAARLERNPFDRIAHFAVGWFAFPLAELYWRKDYARSKILAAFFTVMTTVAMAGLWEIVEWLYAVIDGGGAGATFLGSQGDEWDAQKEPLAISRVCHDPVVMQRVYDIGRKAGEAANLPFA